MSNLTVDNLKAALASKGIKVPSNSKKSEYIKLYKEHVAPLHNIKINDSYNQFSSDDEDVSFPKLSMSNTSKSKTTTTMSELSYEDLEISSLSDEDLFQRLSKFGVTVGPIVDSTRRIYQKKLIRLMGGDVLDSSFNEVPDEDEDFSDNESGQHVSNGNDYQKKSETVTKMSYTTRHSPPSVLRSRMSSSEQKYEKPGFVGSAASYNKDLHTPSPRPSLRTVTSTTKYVSSEGKNYRETTSTRHSYLSSLSKNSTEASETKSYLIRLLVKWLFIVILVGVLYCTYQYLYSESPFKGLESLAKQALDSADGEVKKSGKKVQSRM